MCAIYSPAFSAVKLTGLALSFYFRKLSRCVYTLTCGNRDARITFLLFSIIAATTPVFAADKTPEKGENWTIPGIEMEFVFVEKGTFQMGGRGFLTFGSERDERPAHLVRITRPFWIGKYEVTQAQYTEIMGENPSDFQGEKKPVESVTWHDAVEFCEDLTARERKAGRLPEGYKYRLPTEAEWEYAAMGARHKLQHKFSGSNEVEEVAWYQGNSDEHPSAVGAKKPNRLGLYDMSGNVWEWCLDGYGLYKSTNAVDPVDTEDTSFRVFRGGGWSGPANYCRTKRRFKLPPDKAYNIVGFRVVLAPSVR